MFEEIKKDKQILETELARLITEFSGKYEVCCECDIEPIYEICQKPPVGYNAKITIEI